MDEQWRTIVGCDGCHEVSSFGRVRSVSRDRGDNYWITGRLLSTKPSTTYPKVNLCHGRVRKTHTVHTLVLKAFVGPPPPGMEARHLDGNRLNNRLDNLAWGTKSENMADRLRHGTNPQASRTECPRGHSYDEANTYIDPRGHRHCRTCARTFDPARHEHGKFGSYVKGCRCDACRAASAKYARERRARLSPNQR